MVAVVMAVGACSSSGGSSEVGPQPQERVVPEVPQPPGEPSDGGPSAAALAKRESLQAEPVEGEDCGTTAADAGWPTTMVVLSESSDCLVAALGESRAATQTFTGRTHEGEALLTRYVVREDGSTEVTMHVISADGGVSTQVETCDVAPGPWTIGVDGRIVVDNQLVC